MGVLAVAAWLATAVAPAYALTSAGKMELLRTYQPVTWFSAAELFTPTNVGAFEGNVRLRWQSASGTFSTASPGSANPTPEEIANARETQCQPGLRNPCWLLDESNCNAADGVAQVQSWVDAPAGNFGVMVTAPKNSSGMKACSREWADASKRPKLVVTYTPR